MTTDAREIPLSLLLDVERERLRLCRELLQRSASPRLARAWAAAVHDGEQRVHQLAAASGRPAACGGSDRALELARAIVAAMEQALAAELGNAALPAKLAPSAGAAAGAGAAGAGAAGAGAASAPAAAGGAADDSWELRVG